MYLGSKASLPILIVKSKGSRSTSSRCSCCLLLLLSRLLWGSCRAVARYTSRQKAASGQDAGRNRGGSAWIETRWSVVPLVGIGRRAVRVPLRTREDDHGG